MTPEVTLAAALAALQTIIGAILLWLVQRVGQLAAAQAEMNGNYRAVAEWRGTHDLSDVRMHGELRSDIAEVRSELRTRFEEVDKIRDRVKELEILRRIASAGVGT